MTIDYTYTEARCHHTVTLCSDSNCLKYACQMWSKSNNFSSVMKEEFKSCYSQPKKWVSMGIGAIFIQIMDKTKIPHLWIIKIILSKVLPMKKVSVVKNNFRGTLWKILKTYPFLLVYVETMTGFVSCACLQHDILDFHVFISAFQVSSRAVV